MFMYRITANESYKAMRIAPEKSKLILDGIASKLCLPQFIKKRVIRARVDSIKQAAFLKWKCDEFASCKPQKNDIRMLSLLFKINKFSRFFKHI